VISEFEKEVEGSICDLTGDNTVAFTRRDQGKQQKRHHQSPSTGISQIQARSITA
jgi:hypothetical protein